MPTATPFVLLQSLITLVPSGTEPDVSTAVLNLVFRESTATGAIASMRIVDIYSQAQLQLILECGLYAFDDDQRTQMLSIFTQNDLPPQSRYDTVVVDGPAAIVHAAFILGDSTCMVPTREEEEQVNPTATDADTSGTGTGN